MPPHFLLENASRHFVFRGLCAVPSIGTFWPENSPLRTTL
jgi:hypothetical protein